MSVARNAFRYNHDLGAMMAKCEDCGNWYPSAPGPKKVHLVPLYHSFECLNRWWDTETKTFPFDLEAELGELFGDADLAMYIFKGNLLFKVEYSGEERQIASFTSYPTGESKHGPISSPAQKEHHAVDTYLKEQEMRREEYWKEQAKQEAERKKSPPFSYSMRPWESVDRNKWPSLWKFYLKMAFLPNTYKDVTYTGGTTHRWSGSYTPYGHNGD